MSKKKIDNLKLDASASEMEQAIKEAVLDQADNNMALEKTEPQEAVIPPKEITAPEITDKVVDDKFGGDFDKLKKSYDESVKWNTRLSQDMAELKKEIEGLRVRPEPKQPEQPQVTYEQLMDWQSRDPVGFGQWIARTEAESKTSEIKKELETLKSGMGEFYARNTVEKYRNTYSDFKDLENEIRDELNSFPPEVVNNPKYYDTILGKAYRAVKGDKIREIEAKALERGRQEALAKANEKKDAFVEGSGKAPSEQPFNLDRMTSSEIFEYMKARGAVR